MTKQRIAIDMDEVMADPVSRFLEWYERDHGIALKLDQLHGKKVYQIVSEEHREIVLRYPHEVNFFKDLKVMADSQEVIRRLSEKYEIFVASAAMEFQHSLFDKHVWLQTHFDFIPWKNYVFCGAKTIIHADFLIDDHAYNFQDFTGEGILFTALHNVHETGYRRVNNWREVAELFL
ncbi:MAG: 5'(3')-deoxyribonucleotidase [Ferruginibacter sp.]|nr:5'(3')-deoxyribonucleotidase [Cytophagales bacterium]